MRRDIFFAAKSIRPFSKSFISEDLEKDVYCPVNPLDFGKSDKLCIYECSDE